MVDSILELLRGLPPELTTMVIAALPVVEVRLAIPIAFEVFHLPVVYGAFLAFLGSVIPAILLPSILQWIEEPCKKHLPICSRALSWVSERVEKRYTDKYRALGFIGLVLFIAIPLPVTGVWTGSLASWLFRMKKRIAIPAIIIGTGISTIIVTLTTLGAFGALRAIF